MNELHSFPWYRQFCENFKLRPVGEFHDAEVVSVRFDRTPPVSAEVRLIIHMPVSREDVGDKVLVRGREVTVDLEFAGLRGVLLSAFGNQNVISELRITKVPEHEGGGFNAKFLYSHGIEMELEFKSVELKSASESYVEKIWAQRFQDGRRIV